VIFGVTQIKLFNFKGQIPKKSINFLFLFHMILFLIKLEVKFETALFQNNIYYQLLKSGAIWCYTDKAIIF